MNRNVVVDLARSGWFSLYLRFGTLGGGGLALLLLFYAWRNTTGHTGLNLYLFEAFFLPLVVAGIFCRKFFSPEWAAFGPSGSLLFVGLAGALIPPLLSGTGILVPYETWVKAGQPVPPAFREWVIGLYALAFCVGLILTWNSRSESVPPAGR